MANRQYFGIKYPFTDDCVERYELDLNNTEHQKMTSDLLHLIFTPKGQRIRRPSFGTGLIKYIFGHSTDVWNGVKQEIQTSVNEWLENVVLDDINVLADEEGREINVIINYTIKEGSDDFNYTVKVTI